MARVELRGFDRHTLEASMRKVFLLAAIVVVGCAKKETPAADTAAAAPAPAPPPPAPAALTAADIKGTWNGEAKREGDTTTTKWTVTSTSDSTGKIMFAANKQSVDFTTKLDADSMVATSKPYNDPSLPKGAPKVTFRSVGHLKDGKLVGTATLMLAAKPDSVLGKSNWQATKAP
jgi:type IV secretory pathway VirB10-like protein